VNASESNQFYVCKSTIAMTDVVDIKACKVLKKVVVGETLQLVADQAGESEQRKDLSRLKFRSARDGKEGWVTLKGNQGTVYLELSTSHYVVERAVSLQAAVSGDSASVRQLEVGEALEVMEPPSVKTPAAQLGAK